jgi:D-tyrosyl-tRNA(Tyr) deacylase
MRAVVQRVSEASVTVDGEVVARIGRGLLVLLGIAAGDGPEAAEWMAEKLAGLRIFENESGKFDRSVAEVGGAMLIVSQFTLCADTRKGRRPSFAAAAPPERAVPLYERVAARVAALGLPVETGRFGARMQVHLVNDGPVTVVVDGPA